MHEGQGDLRNLLREFEIAMQATTNQIKLDLERAKAVVRESTSQLDRNLNVLRATTAAQRHALQAVSQAFHGGDGEQSGFAAASEALLRQFVDEIVRVSRDSMRMIEQLTDLSTKVDGIIHSADAIDGLARETRFIAFNARIETHRAGDAGRTFKVVADEVKRLANASSTLSNEIREGVRGCQADLGAARRTSTGLASHDMSGAIDSHRGLATAINKLEGVNRDLDQMLETISTNVSDALQALHFENTLSQILHATVKRVEGIGELSVRALQTLDRGRNGERAAPLSQIVDSLRALGELKGLQPQTTEQSSAQLF